MLIADIGGCEVRGMPIAGGAGRTAGPVTVYVANQADDTVTPIRAASNTAGRPIRVSSAGALAMAADGRTVYVANPDGDTITPISTATEEPGQPIVVGPSPDAMAVTPDGTTVLVLTSTGITGVTPVDAVTNRAGKPVAIRGAYALAVAPGGGTAYVLAMPDPDSQQGFVVPVHVRTSTASVPIKAGLSPQQIAFTPDGTMAYVANYASETVTPIRLADGPAGPPIATGKIPARLAVSPDGRTVYVLDSNIFGGMSPGIPFRMLFRMLLRRPPFGPGRVIPIHVAANSAGRPIKVGRLPVAIAIAA